MASRTSRSNGNGIETLVPREFYNTTFIATRDNMKILELRRNSLTPSNEFSYALLNESWTAVSKEEFKAEWKEVYMVITNWTQISCY
ncbi:Catalase/peroxidase HPI [Phytophthora megakarya]|uniref:Catalase/peroxidase HPI n=1 Tax=Phytophthora megakarya TaxID=4795 RepID=A0A225UMZ3_9STRA|nr:Catalase/peroxidase HPI [Phytophthora megakarya]